MKGIATTTIGLVIAALAAAVHAQEAPAGAKPRGEWQFEAGVNARETYTDNVTLNSNKQSDLITDISPYFSAKKEGARLKVDARYALQNLIFLNDANRNALNHQLAAHANAELLENHLYFDASASAQQQASTLTGATGVDNSSATGNLTSVYNFTLSPYWRHRFGTYANLLARYTRAENSSSGNTISDSSTDSMNLNLDSGSGFGQLLWGLSYSDQQNNNKTRSNTGFTTASARIGYALTRHLQASLTAGYEENQYQAKAGAATQGSYWDMRMSWAPTRLSKFELGYGDHYYGKSMFGKISSHAGHLNWDLDYSQSVTTSSNQAARQNPAGPTQAGNFGQPNNQTLSNSVFLNNEWRAGLSYKKGRGNLGLTLYRRQQTSQESGINLSTDTASGQGITGTTQTGADFTLGWKLSRLTSSNLRIGLTEGRYAELNRTDKTGHIELDLSHNFLRNVSGGLSLRHQARKSDQANSDYTESAAIASLNAHF